MSKKILPVLPIIASILLILQFFTVSAAQDIEATLTFDANTPNLVHVQGRFLQERIGLPASRLRFVMSYGDVNGLIHRISNIKTGDFDGNVAGYLSRNTEWLASAKIDRWSYDVDLALLKTQNAASRVSWMRNGVGVLMIDDLLPETYGKKAKIRIIVPPDWKLFSTENNADTNEFEIADREKAAFVIGSHWRERQFSLGKASVRLLLAGDWYFSDDEAAAVTYEIFTFYAKMFGSPSRPYSQIAVFKFAENVTAGNWEADARGSTVSIASSDMPFKTQSLQRLHEQLRHEVFHLWVPNGLSLTGNYDWFYEGFALYHSLKMGVAVNRIRFDDYLDTLSRAYDIDSSSSQRNSLIDSSKNRWNGSNTRVYARGMLVAFLFDLAMLDASRGKRSTEDLLREISLRHGLGKPPEDGNWAMLNYLKHHAELTPIADRYITGSDPIEWSNLLRAAGIEAEVSGRVTTLRVTGKPSGRQKDLLDKLGYNNWRKLANGK